LCPLAALGALDGPDLQAFAAARTRSAVLRQELEAFERVVGQIGLSVDPVAPAKVVRERVVSLARGALGGVSSPPAVGWGARPALRTAVPWLSLVPALGLALGGLAWRSQRDEARREAARARTEADTLTALNRDLQARLDATQQRLESAEAFRTLVAHRATRIAGLAGLPAAPGAQGRVVWNPDMREAVLFAVGLPPAPAGKAYEAWVIAGGAPVAAGLFRVADVDGTALHTLPRLDDVARAKTFAVTLEPEAGVKAPTGPMVLAGPAT
jgi:hypothetical protein